MTAIFDKDILAVIEAIKNNKVIRTIQKQGATSSEYVEQTPCYHTMNSLINYLIENKSSVIEKA